MMDSILRKSHRSSRALIVVVWESFANPVNSYPTSMRQTTSSFVRMRSFAFYLSTLVALTVAFPVKSAP